MAQIKFKKFLLNRITITPNLTDYLENCLATDDDICKYSFHKIMLHNWTDNEVNLYEALSGFFTATFIPINFITQNGITTFYTSSLRFVLNIIKMDFLFPYMRNMCSIDILLNDKTSMELFETQSSVQDIVGDVVSSRFKINFELDLSNFCKDKEFAFKKIEFYKLSLLAQFKILMLRVGKDTKYLNLSYNNLSQVPLEILNFFIKGDLIGVDLSYNEIPSLVELQRVSSKIEKLWVEGNPLCEELDPMSYLKQISIKFPRLIELDGIKINNHGMMMPFYKSFLISSNRKTKMFVEKFVTLFFSHFDSTMRHNLEKFYENTAMLTISTNSTGSEQKQSPASKTSVKGWPNILAIFKSFPLTVHDRTTFTIDVPHYENKALVLIIEGLYKEKSTTTMPKVIMFFRRTFVFDIYTSNGIAAYHITNEMLNISLATKEVAENSFKLPIRNENQLTLIDPESEDCDVICRAFTHYTRLQRTEAERRLKQCDWDIHTALKQFCYDYKLNIIPQDKFRGEDDVSDVFMDYEIDY